MSEAAPAHVIGVEEAFSNQNNTSPGAFPLIEMGIRALYCSYAGKQTIGQLLQNWKFSTLSTTALVKSTAPLVAFQTM